MGKRKKQAIKDIDNNVEVLDKVIENIPQCKESLTNLKNKFKEIASQIGKKVDR